MTTASDLDGLSDKILPVIGLVIPTMAVPLTARPRLRYRCSRTSDLAHDFLSSRLQPARCRDDQLFTFRLIQTIPGDLQSAPAAFDPASPCP
jgi:hypothetical protein